MTTITFPYVERHHPLLGSVKRPLLRLELHSERFNLWIALDDVLADTGADLSVVPLPFGQLLVTNVESGQPTQLGGIVSSTSAFNGYIHQIQARLGETEFELLVAVVTTATIPPIFGRRQALDRFEVRFVHGQELIIET